MGWQCYIAGQGGGVGQCPSCRRHAHTLGIAWEMASLKLNLLFDIGAFDSVLRFELFKTLLKWHMIGTSWSMAYLCFILMLPIRKVCMWQFQINSIWNIKYNDLNKNKDPFAQHISSRPSYFWVAVLPASWVTPTQTMWVKNREKFGQTVRSLTILTMTSGLLVHNDH